MSKIIEKIQNLLKFENASRSEKAKKNIVLMFILNGFNFLSILLLVPLTIDYLGPLQYGIWLTMSSVFLWLGYFDFGIGNGLRNKIAECLAVGNVEKAKSYVSTAYAFFTFLVVALILIFVTIFGFINWTAIFNSPENLKDELNLTVVFVFVLVSVQLLVKLISAIINADQRPALNTFLNVCANLLTFIFVYILNKTTQGSLLLLGLVSILIPVIVFSVSSVVLYRGIFDKFVPSYKAINFKYSKELINLGLQFFTIQLSLLIVYATDNIIITQLFNPSEVTVYNVAYKYFSFIPLLFNVLLTPFWSAFTEAFVKDDIPWIKNVMKKIIKIWGIISAAAIVMVIVSTVVYEIWVGKDIQVPISLSIMMGLFVIILNWNNIFAYFINGVGKIRLQIYNALLISIINIPLSIYFAKNLQLGITGVITATCVCLGIGTIWIPIQYLKIISKKAKGIWNK